MKESTSRMICCWCIATRRCCIWSLIRMLFATLFGRKRDSFDVLRSPAHTRLSWMMCFLVYNKHMMSVRLYMCCVQGTLKVHPSWRNLEHVSCCGCNAWCESQYETLVHLFNCTTVCHKTNRKCTTHGGKLQRVVAWDLNSFRFHRSPLYHLWVTCKRIIPIWWCHSYE